MNKVILRFTFQYGSTYIAYLQTGCNNFKGDLHSNMVLLILSKVIMTFLIYLIFTFQYGSTYISLYPLNNFDVSTFTFQYGSTYIFTANLPTSSISTFTFQYGSTYMIWCKSILYR